MTPDPVAGSAMAVADDRVGPAEVRRVQLRTVRSLTASQVLGGVGVTSGIAVGGLLAAQIGHAEAYAGVAQACSTLGGAVLAVPIARLMSRRGRRPGLAAAYGLAGLGATLAVLAAAISSVALLLVAMLAFGAGTTANLQARYAATDLATAEHRSRALSTVVWATTVGAVLGPNLADLGGRVAGRLGLVPLAGSFLFSIASFALAGLAVLALLRPDPLLTARALQSAAVDTDADADAANQPRQSLASSLRVIRGIAGARLGLLAVAVAHTVMVGVMVMTPVHMGHGGATLRVIGLVISVHILGMYAFAPLVGMLADRYGRRRALLVGAVIQLGSVVVAGTAGEDSRLLGIGLFLLGLGWSFGLIAGSTLLTETVPMAVRPGVQGAADLVIGLSAGVGGLAAGVVVDLFGYPTLNAVAAVVVLPVLAAVLRTRGSRPVA
ncbi:MAG: MFS transporter [Actinobacteria bacterium]|nr:MFS transporter [Actinomycetota bacterium]